MGCTCSHSSSPISHTEESCGLCSSRLSRHALLTLSCHSPYHTTSPHCVIACSFFHRHTLDRLQPSLVYGSSCPDLRVSEVVDLRSYMFWWDPENTKALMIALSLHLHTQSPQRQDPVGSCSDLACFWHICLFEKVSGSGPIFSPNIQHSHLHPGLIRPSFR